MAYSTSDTLHPKPLNISPRAKTGRELGLLGMSLALGSDITGLISS